MYLWFLLVLLFFGCNGGNSSADFRTVNISAMTAEEFTAIAERERAVKERTVREHLLRQEASRIAAAMDDRQLATQVLVTGIDGRGQLTPGMRNMLEEYPVGGIMLFGYNLNIDNDAIQALTAVCTAVVNESSVVELHTGNEANGAKIIVTISPFVAVDHEGGSVNRFRPGVADLPHAISYWELAQNEGREAAIDKIYSDSLTSGMIINSLGVNLNFAPVVEHLNDDNREFLSTRSYGSDPGFTAEAAAAFIAGMAEAGILCVVKHFPGNAGIDPHYHPSVLSGGIDAMAELAAPFDTLIRRETIEDTGGKFSNGFARAIIVSHSVVPAWDSENIASLSEKVMGTWLRRELRFKGLLVSDDFIMEAARRPVNTNNRSLLAPETAAVLSLAAGSDMILVWPPALGRAGDAIQTALDNGSLSRERLQEAVERILFEKLRMGMIREK